MAGIKRKSTDSPVGIEIGAKNKKSKTVKPTKPVVRAAKPLKKAAPKAHENDLDESDTSEQENGYYGFSAKDDEKGGVPLDDFEGLEDNEPTPVQAPSKRLKALAEQDKVTKKNEYKDSNGHMLVSSSEAHAKQRALAKERKAAKPNADSIARSKKIWEKLRRKSHVSLEERKDLAEELFTIITGRIKELAFKHDSVRVIQCALKYANQTQRKQIADELRGEYRTLSESKYAKFLIAKLIVDGDREIRNMIIAEFYGHVKRLINHPEASWILDDIYRQIATQEQKALLLREWYGPEFALFKVKDEAKAPANLAEILKETPEKRQPILQHLHHLINQLIQKKLNGFTMLHDAILQYYSNCRPGSEEATEFLQLLQGQGDEEEKDYDLLKNLAFTASGSRVVCMAFAHGNAKDRRHLLKVYKDTIELIAHDTHAHDILLTAYDVVDDTKGTFKAFFPELIGGKDETKQREAILEMATHSAARTTLLYPFAAATSPTAFPKWLLSDTEASLLEEMHGLRTATSKKDPDVRRKELINFMSGPLLQVIASDAATLAESKNGCQFITELLLAGDGDKAAALQAVADLVQGDPHDDKHLIRVPSSARMIKALIQGGHFDAQQRKIHKVADASTFCDKLFANITDFKAWATSEGAFTLVALLEQEEWTSRSALQDQLKKHRKSINAEVAELEKQSKQETTEKGSGAKMAGMRLLSEKLS